MKRCRFAVVPLAALLTLSACDRAPVDPLDPRADLSSLLSSDGAAIDGASALAMPGLLHAAVRKVYTEQGIAAARSLVADLRELHEQMEAAQSDGDNAGSVELQRLHAEEIRIVLHVFGDALAGRIIAVVRADAAALESAVAELEAGGRTVPQARESLARISGLLQQGAGFLEQGDAPSALAVAARAGNEADGIRRTLAETSRLPTITALFDDAVAQLRTRDAYMADRALEKYNALDRAAQQAVQLGNRDRAHAALEAVRKEQIRFVLTVLGPAAAERVLLAVEQGQTDAEAGLARAGSAGRDVYRLERMLAAARDLQNRAARALAGGDAATALDLGSHAANLIHSVRLALTTF